MDQSGPLQKMGWVQSSLPVLVLQAIKDAQKVEESINEIDWALYGSPPLIRTLCIRGFRGKMGASLREWEAQTDFVLDNMRKLDAALIASDERAFSDHAREFIDNQAAIMKLFKVLLVNMTTLPLDVEKELREDENGAEISAFTEKHCQSIATLVTTLEMMVPQLLRYLHDRGLD